MTDFGFQMDFPVYTDICLTICAWAGIAQLAYILATDWTVGGSNPGGDEIFRTPPDPPWGPPSLLYIEYRVVPGVKRPGRGIDHPPRPGPRLKKV